MVNVYLAPSTVTAFAGVIRVVAICIALGGTLWVAPPYLWDVDKPTWVAPAGKQRCSTCQYHPTNGCCQVAFGATTCFVVMTGISHGTVCSIRAHLPRYARGSKEDLVRFANNMPPNTRLKVQFFRGVPWLVTREMYFSDLRRVPPKWRLANLEYVAADEVERMSKLSGWTRALVKAYFCSYWVNIRARDRSAVRGAWEK